MYDVLFMFHLMSIELMYLLRGKKINILFSFHLVAWCSQVVLENDAYYSLSSAYLWYFSPCFLNIRCIRVVYSMDITGRRTEFCGTPLCSRVIGDVIVYLDTLGAEIQVGQEP